MAKKSDVGYKFTQNVHIPKEASKFILRVWLVSQDVKKMKVSTRAYITSFHHSALLLPYGTKVDGMMKQRKSSEKRPRDRTRNFVKTRATEY